MPHDVPPTVEEALDAGDRLAAALEETRATIVELEKNQIPGHCDVCARHPSNRYANAVLGHSVAHDACQITNPLHHPKGFCHEWLTSGPY